MSEPLDILDPAIARLSDLIRDAGFTCTKNDADGSWYFRSGDDHYRHLSVRDDDFVLGQVDRANPEVDIVVSSSLRDVELYLVYWLCRVWRSRHRLPRLMTASIPLTADKAAQGYEVSHEPGRWILADRTTGIERMWGTDDTELVTFSYYSSMTPDDLQDALKAPTGKPPFFPVG
ncbi:Imm61 family immunity protein [Pseudarthrobacter sp. PvP090]|uniref:Imm61 family immunity protein n=1 Tax=Pseudarthrobacter sp. PvP090 TaxID=3156393 RepID=UPI00339AD808